MSNHESPSVSTDPLDDLLVDEADLDEDAEQFSWERWTDETSPHEAAAAEVLLTVEPGDRIAPDEEGFEWEWEVYTVNHWDGHTDIHMETDNGLRMTFTVVREKYVFLHDRDTGAPVAVDWSDMDEPFPTAEEVHRA